MVTVSESVQTNKETGELVLRLVFGAGENSSSNPADIDVRECTTGQNFALELDSGTYAPRPPFDLSGTAPNNLEVRGFVEFERSDGNISMLVQAGGDVYQWDGVDGFTKVGDVSADARLRGGRHSTSEIDDFVIITDLNKKETVKTWDGTTFTDFVHNLGGDFFAKYCRVDKERAFFFNVKSGTTDTPHLIVGSGRLASSSVTAVGTLTVTNRPSSSLGDGNPFFLPTPDLKAINGVAAAFGLLALSTKGGQVFQLTGATAKDFSFEPLFRDSAAQGDEAMIATGNDIFFGRAGRIDTLLGTLAFGDVEVDDASRRISNAIREVKSWAGAVYDPVRKRAYWWPENGNEVWTFAQPIYEPLRRQQTRPQLSPWSKWVTDQGNGDFRQSSVALCKSPADGLDRVYWGATGGKFYAMDGGGAQDGGTDTVIAKRTSGLIELPIATAFDVEGVVSYKKVSDTTLTLNFLYSGAEIVDESASLTIPSPTGGIGFGGAAYFGGEFYFGVPFAGRIETQPFSTPGQSSILQVEAVLSSATGAAEIHEILIRFKASSN